MLFSVSAKFHVPAFHAGQVAAAAAAAANFCSLKSLHVAPFPFGTVQRFSQPTPIQAAVLPVALRDQRDIIGAAQTGSGKTLAFGLPIMQHLLQVWWGMGAMLGCAGPGGRAY
jgi:hypothetical protein